ncbi:MAG: ribonuclease R [Micavibrio sp.]|nr:MAG: ribonuclease R [Micavibrio sp.]
MPEFPKEQDILDFVKESDSPVSKREIARAFQIKGREDRVALKTLLKALTEDGRLEQTRGKSYAPPESLPPVTTVKITAVNADGEWLAEPEKWHGSGRPPLIILKAGKTADPEGTTALVRIQRSKTRNKTYEGKIIKHFSRESHGEYVVGTIHFPREDAALFFPVERGNPAPLPVPQQYLKDIRENDLVAAYAVPGRDIKIVDVLGQQDDPKLLTLIAIYQQGIPNVFPKEVLDELDSEELTVPQPGGVRKNLQDIPLVTIDGADARDFDDAVFAEPDTDSRNKDGWHIIVAIADVAHYVRPGTALNAHALERGNSTYFPDRVVPMLPEKLSNDLCSLMPNVPRACFAVHLWISAKGDLLRYKFVRGVMKSHARLTYEQLQDARNGNPDETTAPLMDNVIAPLYAAFNVLDKSRTMRGALELELPEYQVKLGEDGTIQSIGRRTRLDSHKLIEEFMILANIAAAKAIEDSDVPGVFRIHPPPDASKIAAANDFLKSIGQSSGKTLNPTPKDLNKILLKVRNTKFSDIANMVLLRSQSQALYHPENQGHFGLSLTHYAHFTSPIRRYADLLVHRALIRIFNLGKAGLTDEEIAQMAGMAEHISTTERRSMMAERQSTDRFTALYLKDRTGADFPAAINGMSRAGLFVTLTETGSDGFIPTRLLPRDYYIHDERHHQLVGKRTGQKFRLCAPVVVRLKEIDVLSGSMIFTLVNYDGKDMPEPDDSPLPRRKPQSGTHRKKMQNTKKKQQKRDHRKKRGKK